MHALFSALPGVLADHGAKRIAILAVSAGLLCGGWPAWTQAASSSNEVILFPQVQAHVEGAPVTNCVIQIDGQRFSFRMPARWGVKSESQSRTILVMEPEALAGIRIQLPAGRTNGPAALQADALEKVLTDRYPGARVLDRAACVGPAGEKGMTFDLVQNRDIVTAAGFRVAFLALSGGVVEFELRTSARSLTNYHRLFDRLVSSFRVQPAPSAR